LNEFKDKLKEIFMMDHAELDFGIYRIMNQKRKAIQKFLDNDLLAQVDELIKSDNEEKSEDIWKRIHEIEKGLGNNIDLLSESIPMVKEYHELKAKVAESHAVEEMKEEVFSHLLTFFSRYYDGGDFISKRRYKDNTYAIPYNGEEVKLYWANNDQYYIKTTEYFQNYAFLLPTSRRRVHFVLKEASTEKNNEKETDGMERRFVLYTPKDDNDAVVEQTANGELNIYFSYVPMPKDTKQDALMQDAFEQIKDLVPEDFQEMCTLRVPTDNNPNRTLLEKHLKDFTDKNTLDYFIHKDLYGFLSRELDFYIKNEVLHIDDLNEKQIASQLSEMKAIKHVGLKIIRMLAQLENFQKRLWLKKKFVLQSDYCITLDRIPETFYAEIASCEKQRKVWVKLFHIDDIKEKLGIEGYSEPLTVEFLKQNPYLVLDTANFPVDFKHRLINTMKNIDENTNGLLINSENFQALRLINNKYKNRVNAVITDPPYNTGEDDFLYKDNYKDSSWLTMMKNRIDLLWNILNDKSWCTFNINDIELFNLMELAQSYSWSSCSNITVKMSHLSGMKMSHKEKKIPKIKESILMFSKGENYTLNPIYEPCSWDEAFSRYNSWIDYNGSKEPAKWTKKSLRAAASERGINVNNAQEFESFCIANANHIYRTAVNDSLKGYPSDNLFHQIETPQHLKKIIYNGEEILLASKFLHKIDGKLTPVTPIGDIWTDIGINNVHNEGGVQLPNGKKPVKLFERLVLLLSKGKDIILDPFAGSATIVHAVINTSSSRKYIAIQSDCSYFDNITKRRAMNVIYSDEWKLDKPVSRKGVSQCFKYIRLEQYEDTLNNLQVKERTFTDHPDFNQSYMLDYMLNVETSDSLLNLDMFENPFDNALMVTKDNELVPDRVDMVETFNYLIGLDVITEQWSDDGNFCTVYGTAHESGDHVLVIWRNKKKIDNETLEKLFVEKKLGELHPELDVVFVNGDNHLPKLRNGQEHWYTRLIEEEFTKRMFEDID
jgi:adenine-specific DNA-methyltransferase